MFEINKSYTNRKGNYTVLALTPPKMLVRYEDGEESEVNIRIQERIWDNIAAEVEARAARKASRAGVSRVQHYIKTLSLTVADELNIPGLIQRVAAAGKSAPTLNADDRLIYYAIEPSRFFAVATITGQPKKAKAKDYVSVAIDGEELLLYPIDVDAHVLIVEDATALEAVELESIIDLMGLLGEPDQYIKISEDDFEFLSEILVELTEDAEDEDDDSADPDEEEEELIV